MDDRARHLRQLLSARTHLEAPHAGGTDCVRLSAGLADGLPGLIVDRFGALVVAVDYAGTTNGGLAAPPLLELVREACPGHHVVAKARASADGTNKFVTASYAPDGAALPLIARERGLKFEIGLDPAHDFGIFLDAAKARMFVREAARGLRVLNLFSYTGAFGVAAAAGGAADVVNVDPNRDYLAWSLRNAALNGVSMRVLPDTAQDHLAKHLRRLARNPAQANYDLVIVDPPAFGVGRGNERVLRLLWPELFSSLLAMAPQKVLLMSNDKAFRSRQSFVELVQAQLGQRYRFERLGTHLTPGDLAAERPALRWTPGGEGEVNDPFYVEPVVLTGTLLA
ncbi:MAG TPA: class I SAM-dependent methyltransferase [Polyangia bacterium]|nr:class I SAM-dependent methyltransferase [Polyangia bacterium]